MTRHIRVTVSLAIATALIVLASACAQIPRSPAGTSSSTARGTLPASAGTYFGFYSPQAWSSQAGAAAATQAEERYLGRKLDIAHWFYSWGKTFPTWREQYHAASGRIPLISWGGTSARSIVNGSQDAFIKARADGVRRLGKPVLLRWFWEMDATTNLSKAGSPATFKAAWARIVSIFRSRGATNAAFVWCPTAWGIEANRAQQYYPGSSTVDWICGDGYNWYPRKPGSTWTTFERAFRHWYAWASTKGKPLLIGETGVQEDPRSPSRKAQWIRDMGTTLRTRMPKVRAVVYFNQRTTSYSHPNIYFDWRLTSASSHAAWRDIGRWAHFRPRHR